MDDKTNFNNATSESEHMGDGKPTDAQISKLFMDILRTRLASAADDIESSWSKKYGDATSNEFQAEKQMIRDLNESGVRWGLGAACVSFLALRRAPAPLMRFFARRSRHDPGTGGPSFDSSQFQRSLPDTTQFGQRQSATYTRPPQGPVRYMLSLGFDIILSMWMGASVTMFLTDKDKIQEGLSKVPLVEGRSALSEELCGDYIEAYKVVAAKGFDWKARHDEYPSLNSISKFVLNCQKRAAYEKIQRRNMGLPPDAPVAIPSPGVPSNLDLDSEEGFGDVQDSFSLYGNTFDEGNEAGFANTEFHENSGDRNATE